MVSLVVSWHIRKKPIIATYVCKAYLDDLSRFVHISGSLRLITLILCLVSRMYAHIDYCTAGKCSYIYYIAITLLVL